MQVNMSHPAGQAFYDSHVHALASYGIDFIKADCMMCGPCYTDEIMAFSEAVRKRTPTQPCHRPHLPPRGS